MAGARQGGLTDHDSTAGSGQDGPLAIRIDTDVFAALTEGSGDDREGTRIGEWLDCWRL